MKNSLILFAILAVVAMTGCGRQMRGTVQAVYAKAPTNGPIAKEDAIPKVVFYYTDRRVDTVEVNDTYWMEKNDDFRYISSIGYLFEALPMLVVWPEEGYGTLNDSRLYPNLLGNGEWIVSPPTVLSNGKLCKVKLFGQFRQFAVSGVNGQFQDELAAKSDSSDIFYPNYHVHESGGEPMSLDLKVVGDSLQITSFLALDGKKKMLPLPKVGETFFFEWEKDGKKLSLKGHRF